MQTRAIVQLVDRYGIRRTYLAALLLVAPVFSGCMGVGSILSLSSVVRDCNQLFLPAMQSEYPFCTVEID